MRTYEALYIIRPELSDEEAQTIANGVEKLITDDGGVIVRSENWGKRRLAYEINKINEGYYVLVRFESKPDFITKFETYFRLAETIIRDLIVLFDEKTLRLEAEQVRRVAALAEARSAGDDDDDDDRPSRPRPVRTAPVETVAETPAVETPVVAEPEAPVAAETPAEA